jgi:hypothetical protein
VGKRALHEHERAPPVTSVIVFLIGLVSEQITSLIYGERP